MTKSLVGEITTLLDVYENERGYNQMIIDLYNKKL